MPRNDHAQGPLNVLLIGGGGREHALAAAIARSPRLGVLYATHTTNPGIAALAKPVDVPVSAKELYRLQQFCDANAIDLVVIGPEDPLNDGFADALAKTASGKPRAVFGPGKLGARLEADKAFCRELLKPASVPMPEGRVFENAEAAEQYWQTRDEPHVIKAAGPAKGKGVILPDSTEEGLEAISRIMRQRVFGDAGKKVIIEERLAGTEVSVLAITDGSTLITLPPCQDHKRLLDQDRGPNTGGMGAFCPAGTIDDDTAAVVERDILIPTLDTLRREEIDYRGVLYAGIMLTPAGPKLLEYNVRFGDPECQPLMTLLESDALDLFHRAATGTLAQADVRFTTDAAVCLVLASKGYPESPSTGITISGLNDAGQLAADIPGVTVYHAGTERAPDGPIRTTGGRVLGITARAANIAEARKHAYDAASTVTFDGAQLRRDIAEHAAATTTA